MVSISDETSGLLAIGSIITPALYASPHLAQLVGPVFVFLTPYVHGWFLAAFNNIMEGRPATSVFSTIRASRSGAEIIVTSPMVSDIIKAQEGNRVTDEIREAGLGWTISVVTIGGLRLRPVYRLVNVLFTVLLLAMPIVVSWIRGDYSGVSSFVYVVFGLAVRLIENVAYISTPPRDAKPENPMGLLHVDASTSTIVLVIAETTNVVDSATSSNNCTSPKSVASPSSSNSVTSFTGATGESSTTSTSSANAVKVANIEDLAHPHLQTRSLRHAALCQHGYQMGTGLCLVAWLVFLVVAGRSETQYTDGYIDLGTMVLSGLGQFIIKQLVTGAISVRTVKKANAITAVAWLAKRFPVDKAGVPPQLLALRKTEEDLIHALFKSQPKPNQSETQNPQTPAKGVDEELWTRVSKCNREQVEEEMDGPELPPAIVLVP